MIPIENTQPQTKKGRSGRWSNSQSEQFQVLMQHYGKNWKKIKDGMKGRTLGQIRSHAQKFFARIGPEKTLEYERKAKLLQALQILGQQKRLKQEPTQQKGSLEQIRDESRRQSQKIQSEAQQHSSTPVKTLPLCPEFIKEQYNQTLERGSQALMYNFPILPQIEAARLNQYYFAQIYSINPQLGIIQYGDYANYPRTFDYQLLDDSKQ